MAPVPACICADTLSACPWSESKASVERPSATAPLPGMIIARATIMAASCARHFLVRSFIVFLLVDVSRPEIGRASCRERVESWGGGGARAERGGEETVQG